MLQLLRGPQEVVRISLGRDLSRIRLLDEVLVALLLGKSNGILLGLEVNVRPLHEIARRLPSHQRVLPAVALSENIPVHPPPGSDLVAALGGRFRRLVNTAFGSVSGPCPTMQEREIEGSVIPDGPRL